MADSPTIQHESAPQRQSLRTKETAQVAILLCILNGEAFLAEQLDSIERQSHSAWKLWVSDNGSTDKTLDILNRYARKWRADKLSVVAGPAAHPGAVARSGSAGATDNFLSIACNSKISADFYAFCDCDDIWEPDKIVRALAWLSGIPPEIPALYCSRTRLIDRQGCPIGLSPLFTRKPGFANAVVQTMGGGNTMVFNESARILLRKAGADVGVPYHDWWLYQIVSGCGGNVFYDSAPSLDYRQHGNNLLGSNREFSARLRRLKLLLGGRFQEWVGENLRGLENIESNLTPENKFIFKQFKDARKASLIPRLVGVWQSGLYRQTVFGSFIFYLAAILGKI